MQNVNTTTQDIDFFFSEHIQLTIRTNNPDELSRLEVLRKDIKQCLDHEILWPAVMIILVGIDLFGKFYAGNDDFRKVRKHFCAFIVQYFKPISDCEAETIYQLRNSLLHAFGLTSRAVDKKEYYFQFTMDGDFLVQEDLAKKDCYQVNVTQLFNKFENAINLYHQDLEKDSNLRKNFGSMVGLYGKVNFTTSGCSVNSSR